MSSLLRVVPTSLLLLVCAPAAARASDERPLPPPAVRRLSPAPAPAPAPERTTAPAPLPAPTPTPTPTPTPAPVATGSAIAPVPWRPVPDPAPAARPAVLPAPLPPGPPAPRAGPAGGVGWRRRGPVEIREGWLLTQPRLSLPAISPDPLPCGAWHLRLSVNRGNDFGWTQTREGELPEGGDRRFLVDGEHQTIDVAARYGLGRTFDVGLRVPLHWRGAGFLDGIIDWWHEWTGLMDNIRHAFTNDLFRVEGRDPDFNRFSWNDETGWGLGNVEASAQWSLLPPRPGSRWSAALVGRLTLPTGTGPFEVGGIEAGLQGVVAADFSPRLTGYAGLGGTWWSEDELDGVRYEPVRGAAFVAFEYQFARTWSGIVQLEYSTNLVTNVEKYRELQLYLNVGAKIDLSRSWELELGVVENLADQQTTVDFGVQVGLVGRL